MNHFREEKETEKIAFLYVSDDMDWALRELTKVQKKYKDLFFVGKLKRAQITIHTLKKVPKLAHPRAKLIFKIAEFANFII